MKKIWPDSFVEEANLTVNVSALRKALGDTPEHQQFIETVPKLGYRFIAPVTRGQKWESLANVAAPRASDGARSNRHRCQAKQIACRSSAEGRSLTRLAGSRQAFALAAGLLRPWPRSVTGGSQRNRRHRRATQAASSGDPALPQHQARFQQRLPRLFPRRCRHHQARFGTGASGCGPRMPSRNIGIKSSRSRRSLPTWMSILC